MIGHISPGSPVDVVVDVDGDGDGDVVGTAARQSSATFLPHLPMTCQAMLSFQRLDVYRISIEFLALAVELQSAAPKGHAALIDQLARASLSIPLNIAEGAGRTGAPDAARFYAFAR